MEIFPELPFQLEISSNDEEIETLIFSNVDTWDNYSEIATPRDAMFIHACLDNDVMKLRDVLKQGRICQRTFNRGMFRLFLNGYVEDALNCFTFLLETQSDSLEPFLCRCNDFNWDSGPPLEGLIRECSGERIDRLIKFYELYLKQLSRTYVDHHTCGRSYSWLELSIVAHNYEFFLYLWNSDDRVRPEHFCTIHSYFIFALRVFEKESRFVDFFLAWPPFVAIINVRGIDEMRPLMMASTIIMNMLSFV